MPETSPRILFIPNSNSYNQRSSQFNYLLIDCITNISGEINDGFYNYGNGHKTIESCALALRFRKNIIHFETSGLEQTRIVGVRSSYLNFFY